MTDLPQLQMVWPDVRLDQPPVVELPPEYMIRTYRRGDETRWYAVMALAGWEGWDDTKLMQWLLRILPESWFMAIHRKSGEIVASALCVHDHSEQHPFGGELGWVASDPAHRGKGLGRAVCAAATARLIRGGYRNIHLYTEDWRLPALKTYLTLGYVPFLYIPEMEPRWQTICEQLHWSYTPDVWRAAYPEPRWP